MRQGFSSYLTATIYYNTLTAYAVKNPQPIVIGEGCKTKPEDYAYVRDRLNADFVIRLRKVK